MALDLDERAERRAWQAVAVVSGAVAALATRRAMTATWRVTRHEEPPVHPTTRGVDFRDAIVWAVAAAVGTAVARVFAERAAASGWRSVTGSPPPDLDE